MMQCIIRLVLTMGIFGLMACDDTSRFSLVKTPAERAEEDHFSGWKCPDHTFIVWANKRYFNDMHHERNLQIPLDYPICILYVDARLSK